MSEMPFGCIVCSCGEPMLNIENSSGEWVWVCIACERVEAEESYPPVRFPTTDHGNKL